MVHGDFARLKLSSILELSFYFQSEPSGVVVVSVVVAVDVAAAVVAVVGAYVGVDSDVEASGVVVVVEIFVAGL